jgi:hypothetical protein
LVVIARALMTKSRPSYATGSDSSKLKPQTTKNIPRSSRKSLIGRMPTRILQSRGPVSYRISDLRKLSSCWGLLILSGLAGTSSLPPRCVGKSRSKTNYADHRLAGHYGRIRLRSAFDLPEQDFMTTFLQSGAYYECFVYQTLRQACTIQKHPLLQPKTSIEGPRPQSTLSHMLMK